MKLSVEVSLKEVPHFGAVISQTVDEDGYSVDEIVYYTCPYCKKEVNPEDDPLILRVATDDGIVEIRKCPNCGGLYKNATGFDKSSKVGELSFEINIDMEVGA